MNLAEGIYNRQPGVFRKSLAGIYGAAAGIRLRGYRTGLLKTRRLKARVISVGNLTVGGAGKTPAAIYIAGRLAARGVKAAVLSRGYKGRSRGKINIVSDGQHLLLGPDLAGDEARVMAEALPGTPVLTGPDRFVLGEFAIERFQSRVLVLDDGFQHLRLDRDLNLLLVDARRPWGNGRLLPAGSLREPRVQAARATAFIVTRADIHPGALIEELERDFPSRPVFTARHRPVRLKSIFGEGQKGFEYLEGRKALAFCGLARPGDFLDTLRDLKVEVVESVAWPDHYQPGREDVDNLLKKAEALGAEVILCTAKDAVKLKQMDPPGQHSSEIWSLEIEFEILDRPDEFERLLYPGGRSGRA